MVGVAALRVRGRGTAFAVLLGGQVLAAGSGRRWEGLRVVVEVAGVALGHGDDTAPWGVVAVTHVRAAGCGGRGKMAVAVGPIAVGTTHR